ncbi:hypothetical protein C5167_029918 [Papaver somniferum]|nr:hypothetical protein C5167_029918 [Papaver somniferum]
MGCFNLIAILFSFSNLLITIQYTTALEYAYHFCLGDNYTTGSTLQANVNLLLSSLSSADPSIINNGYYNTTVGADISLEDCLGCVRIGTEEIKGNDKCPNSTQAIIWYDECMVRYSDEYYFNIMQVEPSVHIWRTNNVSNPDQFIQTVGDFLKRLAGEAVSNNGSTTSIKFATGDTNFDKSTKVYGLVQCTADISLSSCSRCLLGAISELSECCYRANGGRVVSPSCYFRYEINLFFQPTVFPSPPPPLSSPDPVLSVPPLVSPPSPTITDVSSSVPSAIAVISALAFWFFCFRRKKTKKKEFITAGTNYLSEDVTDEVLTTESLQFNFGTVKVATDNFSKVNKLGKGGFGSVYKGTLPDRQEIAVKRLSKNSSGQGEQEFKNEVTLLAKLQHKYLLKLVGFSLAGAEKLLIYEFMPNTSLDRFLFDPIKCIQLDWERRSKIIVGVARGLVYHHEESRLKIIHRDLKASNILLDMDMNPKIADFGMARLFVLDQTQGNTKRIVGTHGYMAPEYIFQGKFSVKSDVFSFGVLVLEILCGQRSSCFQKSDFAWNLQSYVWRHWNNGSAVEILDPTLKATYSKSEVVRCVHIALLCVQENAEDRPSMPTVVQMLNSHSGINLDLPLPPALFAGSTTHMYPNSTLSYSEDQGSSKDESISLAATCSMKEASPLEDWLGIIRKNKLLEFMIIKSKNMGSFNSVLIFFIYLFILSKVSITIQYTTAQPDYVYHFCLGENYTTNSRFQTNLNLLLPSLSLAETSIINNAYYNNTVGESADTIYESLQRRPDVTFGDCQSCVEMANQEIKGRCPNSKQAIIWYEVCMLRYSNQYYFNIMQESPAVYLFNTNNVSNPDKFNPILDDLMNDLVKEATSSSSTNFATLGKHFDDFGKVYGLVQCTADMPSNTCNRCLLGAISEIPNCCDGKRGGRVIRPSCNFRYEVYPFMGHINTPSPPFIAFPAPLQPPPSLGSPPLTTNTTSPKYFNNEIRSTESLQFNFGTVGAATNNFSEANKLGQGGFGSVYKGILSDSQEIAVKRLSKNSGQGEQEFKNEVTLVAKLQHRNLVKLVGFSLSGEEKLLIYEFMQNASLDQFLFDPVKSTYLDWETIQDNWRGRKRTCVSP